MLIVKQQIEVTGVSENIWVLELTFFFPPVNWELPSLSLSDRTLFTEVYRMSVLQRNLARKSLNKLGFGFLWIV